MREVQVLCGDAAGQPGDPEEVLRLDHYAREGRPERVTLTVERITAKMVAGLPDRLADLLEIASYVYCADQFVTRDTDVMTNMGERWQRKFRFRMPVRDLLFWTQPGVSDRLAEVLEFLSGDRFGFEFQAAGYEVQQFMQFGDDGPEVKFQPDEVIMFSGGLDSCAGVLDALLARRRNVLLVSHQSSPLVASVQNKLINAIRSRAADVQLLHVGVTVNTGPSPAKEYTQRTRAFLFATLGLVVGQFFGLKDINFFENGVVSVNLPLAEHVLGTRATRTTHPRFLHECGAFFGLVVNQGIRVKNGFFWNTKADVVRKIFDLGCGELIPQTFSCTRVRPATGLSGRHCGVCSQCLDRRFGVLSAKCGTFEPMSVYAVDLLRGERKAGRDTVMAESYVLAASRYAHISADQFITDHGELLRVAPYLELPTKEALRRLHELHVRHGSGVIEVFRTELARGDPIEERRHLPPSCLLSILMSSTGAAATIEPTSASAQASSRGDRSAAFGIVERPIGFAVTPAPHRVIFRNGIALSRKPAALIAALLIEFREGQARFLPPADYRYRRSTTLAGDLGISDEHLRRVVLRSRRELRRQYQDKHGASVADDDVIQNIPRRGYRLNPRLVWNAELLDHGAAAAEVTDSPTGVTHLHLKH